MKLQALIALSVLITSCASTKDLPIPTGTPIKINTPDEIQQMLEETGVKLIGPRKDEDIVKRHYMRNPMMMLSRQPDPDEFKRIGALLVETTVTVGFPSGLVEFVPSGSQRFHIRQLAATASRIVIKGRTSNETSSTESLWVATERAEAVKRHLLGIGFPGKHITINAMGSGDFIANNRTAEGRALNRRAEIEFVFEGSQS